MGVKISWTGASAVPNWEDTAGVQICANSGVNAKALSLKLVLTMALKITKIHLKRFTNNDNFFWPNVNLFAKSGLNLTNLTETQTRSAGRFQGKLVSRCNGECNVTRWSYSFLHALSDSPQTPCTGYLPTLLLAQKFDSIQSFKIIPKCCQKKSNLCCHNTQKETEECKPLLQQKCHQVRNMLVGVWSKRFNGTKVQMLTKYTNTHQMCKYSPNGRCSPNVQKHTKCTNAYQMC